MLSVCHHIIRDMQPLYSYIPEKRSSVNLWKNTEIDAGGGRETGNLFGVALMSVVLNVIFTHVIIT